MTEEQKHHLTRMKTLKASPWMPEDLRVAINTFIKQAVIVGEYSLD